MAMINNNNNTSNVIPLGSFTSGEQFALSQVEMKFEYIRKLKEKNAKL